MEGRVEPRIKRNSGRRDGAKQTKKRTGSKDSIVWQGVLVKLKNELYIHTVDQPGPSWSRQKNRNDTWPACFYFALYTHWLANSISTHYTLHYPAQNVFNWKRPMNFHIPERTRGSIYVLNFFLPLQEILSLHFLKAHIFENTWVEGYDGIRKNNRVTDKVSLFF